jgi:MFS family permease
VIGAVSKILAVLLFALMPEDPNYWAWIMPAMLAEAACVDVVWIVSNVFLTTSLPKNRQGLAGALINVSVYLGSAFFLAFADVAAGVYEGLGWDDRKKYQGIFFFGVGLGSLALLLCLFIPMGRATSSSEPEGRSQTQGSDDERPQSADSDATLFDSPTRQGSTRVKQTEKPGVGSSSSTLAATGRAATGSRLGT